MSFTSSRLQAFSLAVLSLLFLSAVSNAIALEDTKKDLKESNTRSKTDSNLTLLLPVNAAQRISLSVDLGKGLNFKPGGDFQKMQEAKFFEFIPQADDINNWTEIITVILKLNIQLSEAAQFNSMLQEGIQKQASDISILKRNHKKHENYNYDEMFITYTHNGKRELMWSYVVAGPLDAVNVQYTIRIPDQNKTKNLDSYVKKIETFKDKHITVISGK